MNDSNLSKMLTIALLSASCFAFLGCASSKMTSNPQSPSTTSTPTKEYEWHDMSSGKSFYGSPLSKTAATQASSPAPQ